MSNFLKIAAFIAIELIISLAALDLSRKFWKNRALYPIKQLSPFITILQGFSFYICQLTLLTLLIFFNSYHVELREGKQTSCEVQQNQDGKLPQHLHAYQFFGLIYIISRGFCYTLTVVKSYRVLSGFQRRKILSDSWQQKIFGKEYVLLIIAFFYGVLGFVMVPILTTKYYNLDSVCWLVVYERSLGGVKYNFWFSEILMLSAVFFVNPQRINDRLIKLTINLQVIYIIWFTINSILAKYFPLVVQTSCLVRSIVMFFGFIYISWNLKENNPTLYISTQSISTFEMIMQEKLKNFYNDGNYCQRLFQSFLKYLDQFHETIALEIEKEICGLNYSQLFNFFEQLESMTDKSDQNDKLYFLLKNNQEMNNIFQGQDFEKIYKTMLNFFIQIYEIRFKKTKAYQNLYQFYDSNLTIQHNFKILDMQVEEAEILNIIPKKIKFEQ